MGRATYRARRGHRHHGRARPSQRIIPVRALDAPDRRARYERAMAELDARRRVTEIAEDGSDGEADPEPGAPFFIDCPRSGQLVRIGRHVTQGTPDVAAGRSDGCIPGAMPYRARRSVVNAYADQAGRELDLARRALAAVTPRGSSVCPRSVELIFGLVRGSLDDARGSVASSVVQSALERTGGGRANQRDVRFLHDFIRLALEDDQGSAAEAVTEQPYLGPAM